MHTRNVVVGICATVVCVMVGSVAIGFSSDLAGSAVTFRVPTQKIGNEFKVRHLKTTPLKRSSSSSAASEQASSSSAAPTMTSCDGARGALADMADVIRKTVPVKASNTALMETLATARFEIEDKYCDPVMTSSSSSAASSVRTLKHPAPSVCNDLQYGTVRYIQCVLDHAMTR
jgi:hypothetical protein